MRKGRGEYRPEDGSRNPALCGQEGRKSLIPWSRKRCLKTGCLKQRNRNGRHTDIWTAGSAVLLQQNGRPAADFCDMLQIPLGKKTEKAGERKGKNMKYEINQNQCGFLMKQGRFIKMLFCGTYRYLQAAGYEVFIENMEGAVRFGKVPKEILLENKEFAGKVLAVTIPEGFIGILRKNGTPQACLTETEYLFWNQWEQYDVALMDMRQPEMDGEVSKAYLSHIPLTYYKKIEIQPGEMGILYYNNQVVKELNAGTYFYWLYAKDVVGRIVDLKTRSLEVTGQEILTADRIGVRINLTCTYRVVEPRKMIETIRNLENQIYGCVQLIIREYIGRYRLDELLEQKEEISGFIFKRLKEEEAEYCVQFQNAGIKDIILPGEIRDIMNTVLVAERRAQANVITRREEVASTRSLLNTAKLMDENKTLYKLKEMECLERICSQVGNIQVSGGGALLEQLKALMH